MWRDLRDSASTGRAPTILTLRLIAVLNSCLPACTCRDALEVCGGLWGEKRQDCLSVFGLDAEQVRAAR